MSFHEIRFPVRLSLGALGGPERRTDIVSLASGFEERNSAWAHSRRRYDIGHALSSLDDIDELVAFFEARHGRLYGFRYRDPLDYKSCKPSLTPQATDQVIGTGDGVTAEFDLLKTYASGAAAYMRPIVKPVAGSVLVVVGGAVQAEGTDFTLDSTSGRISFTGGSVPGAGAVISAGYQFDVPVRFDRDRLTISLEAFAAGEAPEISLLEVRLK